MKVSYTVGEEVGVVAGVVAGDVGDGAVVDYETGDAAVAVDADIVGVGGVAVGDGVVGEKAG